MQHAAYTAYLEAAFDAVMAAEAAEHAAHGHVVYDPTPLHEMMCVCGYLDPPPRNLNDQLCDPCESRKEVARKKEAAEMEALVTAQLALPDTDPARIFTDAELRDTYRIHCDKRGLNRLLLRAMRKKLGIRF
jgi:hypothetical protein